MEPEEYESHPVWTVLASVKDVLEGDLGPPSDEARRNLARVHSATEYVDALRATDPHLVEPQGLRELLNPMESLLEALNRYASAPELDANYLQTAAGYIPAVLTAVRIHFPIGLPDEALAAAKAAATRYRKSLDAEVAKLRRQIDQLESELAETQTNRANDAQAASNDLSELSSHIQQRTADIDNLIVKLQSQIDGQRTAFEQEASSRDAAFRTTVKAYEQEEQARVALAREAEDERLLLAQETDEAERAERRETAEALIAALQDYRDQAKDLVDTTSRHAVAGEYGSWAAKQARAALVWTVVALVIGLGTVGLLVYAIESASDDSVQFTAYKISVSIVGLIVAGYAARQASEHRREERTAKKLALDLAALGPFLEQVQDAEPLRQAVAKRVFAPEQGEGVQIGDHGFRLRGRSMTIAELIELIRASQGAP